MSSEKKVFLQNLTLEEKTPAQETRKTEHWAVFFAESKPDYQLPELDNYRLMAVDGGLNTLLARKTYPHVFLGDRDSFTDDFPEKLSGTEIITFPVHKDFLDGEAAIKYLQNRPFAKVLFFSFFQGRWDMSLTHFLMLYQMQKFAGCSFFILENGLIFFASGTTTFYGKKGQHFSLVPLEKMTKVSISGALYGLNEINLQPGRGITLSNSFTEEAVRIKMDGESMYLFMIINGDKQ